MRVSIANVPSTAEHSQKWSLYSRELCRIFKFAHGMPDDADDACDDDHDDDDNDDDDDDANSGCQYLMRVPKTKTKCGYLMRH